jgi:beta-lactamase regulating signal transducer with metallopeptidase domain
MAFGGLQPIIDAPVWVVLLLKITVILFAAWLVHLAIARTNPRYRVFLWRMTAVGLIVLPTVAWLLPAIKVYVQQPPAVTETAAVIPVSEAPPADRAVAAQVPMGPSDTLPDHLAGTGAANLLSMSPNDQPDVDGMGPSALPRPKTLTTASPESSFAIWPALLLAVWLGGIAVLGFRLCLGHYWISALARRAEQPPPSVRHECMRVARAIGCRSRVEVVQSTEVASPFLCGLRRPLLLLPARMCEVSYSEDLPGILAHELTHARSHDVLWNAGLQLVSALLWFHPLAWRIRKVHLAACELVSDATSASFVGDLAGYCRTLARVAVDACDSLPASGIAMARTSAIGRRLNALKERVFHLPLRRRNVIAFGLATLLSVTVLGTLQLALAEPAPVEPVAAAEKAEAKPAESSIKPGFRAMRIRVVDTDGKPIINAGITVRCMIGGPIRYRTDTEGSAAIEVPKEDVKSYQILVWDNKHVTVGASWRGNAVMVQVPETFTFTLESGTIFGGIVRDEQSKPIAGAKVTVEGRKRSLPDNPRWVSINDTAKTDAEGKWQVRRIPKDLAGFELSVKIKRPDVGGVERFDRKALPIDKLRNQTAVFVMREGIVLEGTVRDPQGKPTIGAAVGLFSEPGRGDYPRTKTDQNGHYRFAVSEPGEYTLAAAAEGYAPDSRRVNVAAESQTMDLRLRKGEMIRLRVVDEEGRPMPAVRVSTAFDNAYRDALELDYVSTIERTKDRNMLTDAKGRWSRLWIPGDELTFYISKQGYARVVKKTSPVKQEQIITLEAGGWAVSGRVVNRETKVPVTKFRVVEGRAYGSGNHTMSWHESQVVENQSGRFSASWDTSGDSLRVLRIEADGYLSSAPQRLQADERQVTFNVELSKGQEITGLVRTADGKPLADVEVALCTATRGLYLKNGRPLQGQPFLIVRTGTDGRFSLPPQRELYFLVVLHDQGFAQVEDKADMKEITLKPWARAEGTLKVGGKPGVRENIAIDLSENELRRRNPRPGEMAKLSPIEQTAKMIELREIPLDQIPKETLDQISKATLDRIKQKRQLSAIARRIHFDYRTQTDAEGHFAFDRVRSGKAKICRSIKISQEGQMSSWTTANHKSVEFVSGQTLTVNLRGPDQSVIRQRELATRKLREQRNAAYRKQDDPEREKRTKAAMKVLLASPPATRDARIEAALEVLMNCHIGKNVKSWATAIRELITIGKPAVAKLIAKLDRPEGEQTLRDLGFVLRGIGDPRAVPALIRAIPRLYPGGGSDLGLTIQDDPDLLKFMQQHDNSTRDEPRLFFYGRPIREIMPALEKITGESHGWMELNFADRKGQGAEQDRIKCIAFLNHAERWADWWSKNWQRHLSTQADAQLDLTRKALERYALSISKMPQRTGLSKIPCGPSVFVGAGASTRRVRSFDEPQVAGFSEGFLDFDTGRRPNPPQELIENSPGGKPSKKLLAWAEQEGVDLIIVKTKLPGSEKPVRAFMPLGMKVWRIENSVYDNLQQELCYGETSDFGKQWKELMAQIDEKRGKFDNTLTASYLFITKEGICGALQIQSPGGWRHQFVYERHDTSQPSNKSSAAAKETEFPRM